MNRARSARRGAMKNVTRQEHHSPWRIFKNIAFLFRYLLRYAPGSVVLTVLNAVLGAGMRILGGVVFVNYIFNAIEDKRPFGEIAIMAVILVAMHVALNFSTSHIWSVHIQRSNH